MTVEPAWPSPEPVAPPAPWQRLSARMLLVHPVHELLRLLPLILALLVFGRGDTQAFVYGLIAAGAAVTIGVVRWLTTEYRVTDEQVQIRKGLLQRSVSSVARDRVRAVEVTARVMHRLMGLSVVTIGTGRNDAGRNDALELDGLATAEAGRLRTALLRRAETSAGDEAPADGATPALPGTVLARWRTAWVRYGPFTLSGFVSLGVLAGATAQILAESGGVEVDSDQFGAASETVREIADLPVVLVVLVVIAAVVVLATLFSTAGYVVAHWRFTLSRERDGTLHVTRGLLTTRATTLEERRLRGLEVGEPLPLRLAGGARVTAIATGGDAGSSALLLPPASRAEAQETATRVLGDDAPLTAPLTGHGPAARQRRYTRALGPAAFLVALGAVGVATDVVHPVVWAVAAAVVLAGAAFLAVDRNRSLGHALTGVWLVTRSGSVVRDRAVLERDGVIGVTVRASFFQRRAGVCTLTATTAGGREGYDLLDVEPGVAVAVADEVLPGLLTPFRA